MHVQLILDEQSIDNHRGVRFRLNPATKHPGNPLLAPGAPHEWDGLQISWPATILRDEEAGLYRCWYSGLGVVQADHPKRDPHLPWQMGYAESRDGLEWTRPSLGLKTYLEQPTNLITTDFDGWMATTFFFNPDPNDQRHRFLSIWKTERTYGQPGYQRALAGSNDGWRWELISDAFYREPEPRHQMQDFWQVVHDPDAKPDYRIRAYAQYYANRWDGHLVRQIGLHHGPDMMSLRDHDPPVLLAPQEGIDDQIHFASVLKLHGKYLMVFESDRFDSDPLNGDLRLAVSDDGIGFRRIHENTPMLARGGRGEWDASLLVTTSHTLLPHDDELRLYYHGCPIHFRNWPGGHDHFGLRGSLFYPICLGMATLPRDRFAFAEGPGHIELRGVPIASSELYLNADGESVRVIAGEARGMLGTERRQSVYRRVEWDRQPRAGTDAVLIELSQSERLYSVGWD